MHFLFLTQSSNCLWEWIKFFRDWKPRQHVLQALRLLFRHKTILDHEMEIFRALVKFVNQILGPWCCKELVSSWWFCVKFCTQNKTESPGVRRTWFCFRLYFSLSCAPGCCFVIKNGWRRVGGMLSESPLEQAGPFLSTRECPVLWLFVLAHVSPCQASSSFFLSFLLSSTHPFRPSKFSSSLFYTGFFVGSSFAETRRE